MIVTKQKTLKYSKQKDPFMFSKIFIIFSLVLPTFLLSDDRETSISGTVYRNEQNIPLQGANVIFKGRGGSEYGASSDKNGEFFLNGIKSGEYDLIITFIGFEDYRESILISEGRSYNIEATLSIRPISLAKLEIISDVDAPYQSMPGAASIMNNETIKLINPIGTQEMLELIPGVNGYADDGIGNSRISIGIRGLNPRRSSRVLILEDGIPIQPALYVYPNMYYNPPADRIDRVEVIKGSGSVLFGPQTMGGIINYFTKRPRNEFGGIARVTTGSNRYSSLFFEMGGWGNKTLKPEIQLLFKRGDGFRDNNSFEQINATFKINYLQSANKNLYVKGNLNYENSNATYTGLTQWSYDNNPRYNPKEDDNFKVFRTAVDIIQTERKSSTFTKTTKGFISYFDRKWWRENDIFILSSDLDNESPTAQAYYNPGNLVRTGNGTDNFGILRTFYVGGLEQTNSIKHSLFNWPSKLEIGGRVYWERFIDDKKIGDAPDSRDGIYYYEAEICNDEILPADGSCSNFVDLNNNNTYDDSETVVGQSHNYETMALSGYLSNTTEFDFLILNLGMRFELFEQERIDRLNGSTYLDQTTIELLPSISFIKEFSTFSIFGGVHKGFTAPSSGALKVTNFVLDTDLDLKAEKSWNKELGIRSRGSSFIDYEISFFNVDIEDMVAAGRGAAFKNLGKITTYGTELNSTLSFSTLSKIHLSHTFLKTEVNEGVLSQYSFISSGGPVSIAGNELPYSPETTLIIGLEQTLLKKINLRLDYKYVSEVFTDFHNLDQSFISNIGIQGPVDSYSLINFSLNYEISDKIGFNIVGKNLMDRVYIGSRLHSNPDQRQANISSGIIPGNRRQINIGIQFKF